MPAQFGTHSQRTLPGASESFGATFRTRKSPYPGWRSVTIASRAAKWGS